MGPNNRFVSSELSTSEVIALGNEFKTLNGGIFKNEPFNGFLQNETGEAVVSQRWKNGLVGRGLNIEVAGKPIGNALELYTEEGELTDLGKKVIQWGEWFGVILPFNTSELASGVIASYDTIQKWRLSMEEDILDTLCTTFNLPHAVTFLRNLGYLANFSISTLTQDQLEKLKVVDLYKTNILDIWGIAEEQPGYWGKKSPQEIATRDAVYGKGFDKWTTAFKINGAINTLLTPTQFALIFEQTYRRFLEVHPEIIKYFSINASDFYENFSPEVVAPEFNQGYDLTSYYPSNTKYQYAILRRLMFLAGMPLKGEKPILVRGMPVNDELTDVYGRVMHPGAVSVPTELYTLVPVENDILAKQNCWWKKWEEDNTVFNDRRFPTDIYPMPYISMERFYHQSKVVLARNRPQKDLADELLS